MTQFLPKRLFSLFFSLKTLFFLSIFIPYAESIVRGWIYKNSFYGLYKYVFIILIEDLPVLFFINALFLSCIYLKKLADEKNISFIISFLLKFFLFFFYLFTVLLNTLFVSDSIVFSTLGNRLFLTDISVYIGQRISFDVLLPSILMKRTVLCEILLSISFFISVSLFLIKIKAGHDLKLDKSMNLSALACLLFLGVGIFLFYHPQKSAFRQAYSNFIFTNLEGTNRFKSYSPQYIQKYKNKNLIKRTLNNEILSSKNEKPINIIQIVFESMSVSQSKLFGNMSQDLFPRTDRIVKERGLWFSNFYQNTYNSASGQFVSMSGHLALPTPNRDYPWHNKTLLKDSLPHRLHQLGYTSEYIASVELASSQLRKMAKLAGFDKTFDISQTHPREKNAHDDKDLYDFVLNKINKTNQPFYFFVVNSTTHPPYLVPPKFKEWNYEKSFLYADKALSDFINELDKVGFFKDGILVVSSDHHPWEPITLEEKEKIKYLPEAKVPCFIIGKGIVPGKSTALHSTVDIVPSIEWLVAGKADFLETQSNLFTEESRQIYHHNGNDRNKVYILCSNGLEEIMLNGDLTQPKHGEICPNDSVDVINIYRINFP